ncbi:hypothetical protein MaudCBS49596_004875 [Microsporum audouinii]
MKERHLLRETVTYSDVKAREDNILQFLKYRDQQDTFFARLHDQQGLISATIACHLGVAPESCSVADISQWLHGSFNVCIPVKLNTPEKPCVLLRIPLPYRVGEEFQSGNADEKVNCEAGAYAWLEENCPDVPVPKLHGFGLSNGDTFTRLENLSFVKRWFHGFRRQILRYFGNALPTLLIPRGQFHSLINSGYLVIEYIEESEGQMLSKTWPGNYGNTALRTNLFRGLAKIMLSLAKVTLPRIGSFTIDRNGYLTLANRPLSLVMGQLENENIPTDIPRGATYSTVGSYVADTLAFHDNRIRYQPNAVNHLDDALYQMTALTGIRACSSSLLQRKFHRGPFVCRLGDIHQSNILVDEDWNIKYMTDLEWTHTCPIELIHPPHWLTNKGVDEIEPEEYNKVRAEFMDILREEEESAEKSRGLPRLSEVMEQGWKLGTFWYNLALRSPTGLFHLFYHRILPPIMENHYSQEEYATVVTWHWAGDMIEVIRRKIADKKEYDMQLRETFEARDTEE